MRFLKYFCFFTILLSLGSCIEDPIDPVDGVTYSLGGPDAGHFVVDVATGAISYIDWFTPSYDQVWDVNGDHIYEVSIIGTNADGTQDSRDNLELVVTETDVFWQAKFASPLKQSVTIFVNGKRTCCTVKCKPGANTKCRRWTRCCWICTRAVKLPMTRRFQTLETPIPSGTKPARKPEDISCTLISGSCRPGSSINLRSSDVPFGNFMVRPP